MTPDPSALLANMLEVADLSIRFLADPPRKPALSLVHGFLSSRHHWLLNLSDLRQHYRIILAELPGHGDTSGCTDPCAWHPEAMVEALDAGRKALDIPR